MSIVSKSLTKLYIMATREIEIKLKKLICKAILS